MRARTAGGWLRGVVAGITLVAAVSGCSLTGSKGVPLVAAHVNGVPIASKTVSDLYNAFANSDQGKSDLDPTQHSGTGVSAKQILATALTYQIRVVFLEALAKQRGISVDAAEAKDDVSAEIAQVPSLATSGFRALDLQIAARAEKLEKAIAVQLLPEVVVNPQEIQSAYDARKDIVGESFRSETEIAFMDDLDSANQLKTQLEQGGDFKTITTALGDKTLRAATVEITPISFVQKDFIAKVKALKQGETSEPLHFEVDNGSVYVVLHVAKRTDLPQLSVADATPDLTKIVQDDKRFQFFDQWFNKQFREADIKVDGYYGKWNKSFLAVT
jgi:hypothetical protein